MEGDLKQDKENVFERKNSENITEERLDLLSSSLDFYELQIFIILANSIYAVNTNQIYFEVVKRTFDYFLLSQPDSIPKEEIKKITDAEKNRSWVKWFNLLRKKKIIGLAIPSYKKIYAILNDWNKQSWLLKRDVKGLRGGKQGYIWFLHPDFIRVYRRRQNEISLLSEGEMLKIPRQTLYFYNFKINF